MAIHSCQYTKLRVPFGHGWRMWGTVVVQISVKFLIHVFFFSLHRGQNTRGYFSPTPLLLYLYTFDVQSGGIVICRLYFMDIILNTPETVLTYKEKNICTWDIGTKIQHHVAEPLPSCLNWVIGFAKLCYSRLLNVTFGCHLSHGMCLQGHFWMQGVPIHYHNALHTCLHSVSWSPLTLRSTINRRCGKDTSCGHVTQWQNMLHNHGHRQLTSKLIVIFFKVWNLSLT